MFIDQNLRDRAENLMLGLMIQNGQVTFDRNKVSDRSLLDDDTAHLIAPDGNILDRLGKEYIPSMVDENLREGFQTYRFWHVEDEQKELQKEVFRLLIVPVTDQRQNPGFFTGRTGN